MKRMYILDGAKMGGREEMHDLLAEVMTLPDYYGRNLDALRDCLTERAPGIVTIENADKADRDCLMGLMNLLLDLAEEDGAWQLELKAGGAEPEEAPGGEDIPGCTGDCDHCTISHPEGLEVQQKKTETGFFTKLRTFFKGE